MQSGCLVRTVDGRALGWMRSSVTSAQNMRRCQNVENSVACGLRRRHRRPLAPHKGLHTTIAPDVFSPPLPLAAFQLGASSEVLVTPCSPLSSYCPLLITSSILPAAVAAIASPRLRLPLFIPQRLSGDAARALWWLPPATASEWTIWLRSARPSVSLCARPLCGF